jgi:hypothetical protein
MYHISKTASVYIGTAVHLFTAFQTRIFKSKKIIFFSRGHPVVLSIILKWNKYT